MRCPRASIRVAQTAVLVVIAFFFGQIANAHDTPELTPVVLVCEHGSVKSLIAASLFDKSAQKRGLPFRAIARGVTPDASVPVSIAAALQREGFDVGEFKPTEVSRTDVDQAVLVVAIGTNLSAVTRETNVPVERWDDVPAATVDYRAAHASLKKHVDALLNRLQYPR